MKEHTQSSGAHSVNIQAGGEIHINSGLSVADVKTIASDVFKTNFLTLQGEAAETAAKRAQEIIEEFLHKLESQPDLLNKANDPDIQFSLFTAQKEYARTGNKDLKKLLINLLEKRFDTPTDELLVSIVLSESLNVVSKLTQQTITALTLVWRLRYASDLRVNNVETFKSFLIDLTQLNDVPINDASYQHIEYTGSGNISMGKATIIQILKMNYKGLFLRGFTEEDVQYYINLNPKLTDYIFPSLHDEKLKVFNFINDENGRQFLSVLLLDSSTIDSIINFNNSFILDDNASYNFLMKLCPQMEKLIEKWDNTSICFITLTSVGIAIAHANYQKLTNDPSPLSIWIN